MSYINRKCEKNVKKMDKVERKK